MKLLLAFGPSRPQFFRCLFRSAHSSTCARCQTSVASATQETILRILFVGDVVGKAGREAIRAHLPGCISQWKVELAIVNGENAADQGFGITQSIYEEALPPAPTPSRSAITRGVGRKLFNSSKTPLASSAPSTTFPARLGVERR